MPKIAELKMIDGKMWARIPALASDEALFLWTKAEKIDAFKAERRKCIHAIEKIGGSSE